MMDYRNKHRGHSTEAQGRSFCFEINMGTEAQERSFLFRNKHGDENKRTVPFSVDREA